MMEPSLPCSSVQASRGLLLGPGDLRMAHLQFLGQAQKVRIPPELGDSGMVQTPFSSVVQDHRTPGTVGG